MVYAQGVSVSAGNLRGAGVRCDLALKPSGNVNSIPLGPVIGMESYQTKVDGVKTAVVTTLARVGAVLAIAALSLAIFGSCPTVYSDNGAVEEAELFSNSIAPLFEARDVDRLHAQPDTAEFVLSDTQGHPVVVGGVQTLADIASRDGQNLHDTLSAADNRFNKTDRRSLAKATADDLNDWIDVTALVPNGADSTTLAFRLRNSLLSSALLYDVMLGPAGARSVDWLGSGLSKISTAVELGRRHQHRAGLHISVWRDGEYREVTHVPDSGPISWHDVAAVIPAQKGEKSLRIRLSFLADQWRFDRVSVAETQRQQSPRIIPIAAVTGSVGAAENSALQSLGALDEKYLQTNPGQRFLADFNVGPTPAGQSRTFLLFSQGYYAEWIRGSWIQTVSAKEPFAPTDQSILTAMQKWADTRESFEARFLKDRVPVH